MNIYLYRKNHLPHDALTSRMYESVEEPLNASWFDRWLPLTATIRKVGERGMMSLPGRGRLRRTMKGRGLLEMVTGQK